MEIIVDIEYKSGGKVYQIQKIDRTLLTLNNLELLELE